MRPGTASATIASSPLPTVANGKVYLATFSNQLAVYGAIDFALTAAPTSQSIAAGNGASYVVYANPLGGYTRPRRPDLSGRAVGNQLRLQPVFTDPHPGRKPGEYRESPSALPHR